MGRVKFITESETLAPLRFFFLFSLLLLSGAPARGFGDFGECLSKLQPTFAGYIGPSAQTAGCAFEVAVVP